MYGFPNKRVWAEASLGGLSSKQRAEDPPRVYASAFRLAATMHALMF